MSRPTRADVLAILPAAAQAQPPVMIERVDAATGTLYSRAHQLAEDDAIELRIVTSTTPGGTPGALPGGLAEGHTYGIAAGGTPGAFRLKTAPGGTTIASFTSAPVGRFSYLWDPGPTVDAKIVEAWDLVQEHLTGHGGEVDSAVVRRVTARLAARLFVDDTSAGDPAKSASFDGARATFADLYLPLLRSWLGGKPARVAAVDETPATADNGAVLVDLGISAPFGGDEGRA